jgi:hypothetical protein
LLENFQHVLYWNAGLIRFFLKHSVIVFQRSPKALPIVDLFFVRETFPLHAVTEAHLFGLKVAAGRQVDDFLEERHLLHLLPELGVLLTIIPVNQTLADHLLCFGVGHFAGGSASKLSLDGCVEHVVVAGAGREGGDVGQPVDVELRGRRSTWL